jgi:hypothetical protein
LALDVLTVALLLLLLRCPGSALRRRWALAGGLALSMSLSALTRESTMVILGMLLAAYNLSKAVFRRWDQHDANLTLAVIGAVLLFCMPTLVNNVVATGTVSPQLDAHAKWWATHEFAGQPGFPTRADVCRGIYFDGELTMFEYMFRLRSVPQAVFGYVKGYWNAFTFDLPRRYSFVVFSRTYHMPWLAMLVPVGMLLCLWQRGDQGLLLVLCALIVLFRFAFVLPLNLVLSAEIPADPPGVEARFILPLVPFSFVFGAIAVGDTGRWLRLRITVWTGSGCHAAGVGQRTPAARFVRLPRNGSI